MRTVTGENLTARAPRELLPSILQERRGLQTAHGNAAFAFLHPHRAVPRDDRPILTLVEANPFIAVHIVP